MVEGEYQPGQGVDGRPRLAARMLPPYSYVPGWQPHPVTDPTGHMFGHEPSAVAPLELDKWQASEAYLAAIDLFNHGYYWEAHEVWEGLWHAAGRHGTVADFLKGLIKLAAAAVKAREGNAAGMARHARRAEELFAIVAQSGAGGGDWVAGFAIGDLREFARRWEMAAATLAAEPQATRLLDALPEPRQT